MNWKNLYEWYLMIGLCVIVGSFITMFMTFITMYPTGTVVVTASKYGEYWFEFVLLAITLPAAFITLYRSARKKAEEDISGGL